MVSHDRIPVRHPASGAAAPPDLGPCTSRRTLLRGLAAIGVTTIGAGVLTACSSDDTATPTTSTTSGDGGASATEGGGGAVEGIPTSEVPVGEARVVDLGGERVVVAQPTEGEFVAFSARCTHQGTIVESSGGLDLTCPNHGSRFDAATGDPENGPATEPLASQAVTVEDDTIVLA